MALDTIVAGKLFADYLIVKERICRIVGTRDNKEVVDHDYIQPSTTGPCLINDEHGEFKYFSRIRESLETALTTGEITQELLPPRAPAYWNTLIKRETT